MALHNRERFIIFIYIILQSFLHGMSEILPADIPRCRSEDLKCIVNISNLFVRKYANGSSFMNFPPIDPYFTSNLMLKLPRSEAVNLKLEVRNVYIIGLSSETFQRAVGFTKDPKKSKFELYGTLPKLEIRGEYIADGKILIIPIAGEGTFSFTLENMQGYIKFKPKVEKRNDGHTYIQVDKIKMGFDPERVKVNFGGLFGGNKQLGDATNAVLNENWKDFWKEFAGTVFAAAEDVGTNVLNTLFNRYSYDEIYLD